MKLGRWSPAAGSNNEAVPDGWPEGQLPSTVNDCAREMMASIRTVFLDAQFIDQGLSPTYITASSFSVPGNQTSAIQIGRRLKIFDATAGVQQIVYATVTSVSFTAVTTIHIESDSGSLTSSLSSFGISILSNNNNGMPRDSDMTVSSLAVTGNMSISGAVAMNGAVQMGSTLSVSGGATLNGTLSVSGAAVFKSALTISGTAVASNIPKAWCRCFPSAGGVTISNSFNVSSVSRSGVGVIRFTFTTPFVDTTYCVIASAWHNSLNLGVNFTNLSTTVSTVKGHLVDNLTNQSTQDATVNIVVFR
jgi:hypothetical protein